MSKRNIFVNVIPLGTGTAVTVNNEYEYKMYCMRQKLIDFIYILRNMNAFSNYLNCVLKTSPCMNQYLPWSRYPSNYLIEFLSKNAEQY